MPANKHDAGVRQFGQLLRLVDIRIVNHIGIQQVILCICVRQGRGLFKAQRGHTRQLLTKRTVFLAELVALLLQRLVLAPECRQLFYQPFAFARQELYRGFSSLELLTLFSVEVVYLLGELFAGLLCELTAFILCEQVLFTTKAVHRIMKRISATACAMASSISI